MTSLPLPETHRWDRHRRLPGRVSGRMIRLKHCQELQPSILAASSRSSGRARKNPSMVQVQNGTVKEM